MNPYKYGPNSMNGCIPCPGSGFFDQRNSRPGQGQSDSFIWPGGQGFSSGFGSAQQPQYYQSQGNGNQQRGGSGCSIPKAYMQVPGSGQGTSGEFVPLQISSRSGPNGYQMSPMNTGEPMTVKVTAPPGAGANGQPITFQLDPSIWFGASQGK